MITPEDYRARDSEIRTIVEGLGLTAWDVIENAAVFIRRRDLARILSHYELFRHVIDLPGVIVDLGIYRGASFFTWTKLMETFCPNDRTRRVYGFDWFEGLHDFASQDGARYGTDPATAKQDGAFRGDFGAVAAMTAVHNQDSFLPGIERCRVIAGDVRTTIAGFLEQNPGVRIALLHCDLDLYEPTRIALELLFPRVVTGGVVAFDEYGLIPWEGESSAVEEYFASLGKAAPRIRKFPFSTQPHGYFIKQ